MSPGILWRLSLPGLGPLPASSLLARRLCPPPRGPGSAGSQTPREPKISGGQTPTRLCRDWSDQKSLGFPVSCVGGTRDRLQKRLGLLRCPGAPPEFREGRGDSFPLPFIWSRGRGRGVGESLGAGEAQSRLRGSTPGWRASAKEQRLSWPKRKEAARRPGERRLLPKRLPGAWDGCPPPSETNAPLARAAASSPGPLLSLLRKRSSSPEFHPAGKEVPRPSPRASTSPGRAGDAFASQRGPRLACSPWMGSAGPFPEVAPGWGGAARQCALQRG